MLDQETLENSFTAWCLELNQKTKQAKRKPMMPRADSGVLDCEYISLMAYTGSLPVSEKAKAID